MSAWRPSLEHLTKEWNDFVRAKQVNGDEQGGGWSGAGCCSTHHLIRRTALKPTPLLATLLCLGFSYAGALVRLGEPLPPHPWQDNQRELVVVYTHDCGDLGELWQAVLQSGLPVKAVNVEEVFSPAPKPLQAWAGKEATAFARALHVGTYPTVLLIDEGRILNAWEGNFTGRLSK